MDEQAFREAVRSLRARDCQLDREGDYWDEEEKERLTAMFREGVGISEIAVRLQRTEHAINQQCEKLDLYRRKERPRRRKSVKKEPQCCCSTCEADPSLCPRRENCAKTEEVS